MDDQSFPNAEEVLGWVEHQSGMGARRPGSDADKKNEDFLEGKLLEFGLENVRKEPIPITHWEAQDALLEIFRDGEFQKLESFPIPYTAFTPPGGLEAPMVYADRKKLRHQGDWNGYIVVADIGFPPLDVNLLTKISLGQYDPDGNMEEVTHPATWVRLGWHLYGLAAQRGAAGFIGIVRDQPGGGCRMYAPYGFKEKDILDKPIPGFWIGRDDGDWVSELARSDSGRARINLSGIREPGTTSNVVGEIPGETDEEVVVLSCHHDSPFESPVEDGSGVSVVLALAKHFAVKRDLKRRLIVVFTAGHFYGSIGTRTFIEEHAEDVVKRAALEITIEHIAHEAVEDSSGSLVKSGYPEATGIFTPFNTRIVDHVLDCLRLHEINRAVLLPAEGPLGDYPPTDGGDWYAAGVPLINYICNPVYLLTDDDALEWVDRDRLPRVAAAFADITRRVDGMSRREIQIVDKKAYRLLMKLLKRISYTKTTFFGMHPVY